MQQGRRAQPRPPAPPPGAVFPPASRAVLSCRCWAPGGRSAAGRWTEKNALRRAGLQLGSRPGQRSCHPATLPETRSEQRDTRRPLPPPSWRSPAPASEDDGEVQTGGPLGERLSSVPAAIRTRPEDCHGALRPVRNVSATAKPKRCTSPDWPGLRPHPRP